jgi:cobalt-zinc-cadmium resistance protein CzcA
MLFGRFVARAAGTRFWSVMMTCFAAGAGLLPAAFANGIGSQVRKPLALVVSPHRRR